jgi:hypothetical protein
MWGMLATFLVLVAGETAQLMPPADSGGTFASGLGVGLALPLVLALLLLALVSALGRSGAEEAKIGALVKRAAG